MHGFLKVCIPVMNLFSSYDESVIIIKGQLLTLFRLKLILRHGSPRALGSYDLLIMIPSSNACHNVI